MMITSTNRLGLTLMHDIAMVTNANTTHAAHHQGLIVQYT